MCVFDKKKVIVVLLMQNVVIPTHGLLMAKLPLTLMQLQLLQLQLHKLEQCVRAIILKLLVPPALVVVRKCNRWDEFENVKFESDNLS